jgi:thermostable 8-oxoguanine DNA glycosylase
MRADELTDPRDRAHAERVESKPSMYRGFGGIGPYNEDLFSELELFVMKTNEIDVENAFQLDIMADAMMNKEADNLAEIAKTLEDQYQ